MGLLVTFFVLSILFSFLCSILEAVLLSITPAYVGLQEQQNTRIARDLVRFKADIDEPLAAILTLNTIAHTVGAIGVGSQASKLFGETSIEILGISLVSWEALIAGLMTLAILIFSEVIPKTIGANHWEILAPFSMATLRIMLIALAPLVRLSQAITRHLKNDKEKPVLSRTDILAMTHLGTKSGVLKKDEQNIITNSLRFKDIRVKEVMTPRIVVIAASDATSIGGFYEENRNLPFSRIPLYREKNDNVIGYALKDEILVNLVENQANRSLGEILREIIVVHNTMPIPALLTTFLEKKEQIALVVDEFGAMDGIATMEDIIETLLGLEIVDESDSTADLQALARENWILRAKKLGIETKAEEEDPQTRIDFPEE